MLRLVAVALLLAAASPAADLPEIQRRGALRVLTVLSEREPEFVSMKPGAPPGFDREILEGYAKSQGLDVEWVLVPTWEQLVPWLAEGRGDLIAGRVTDTASRRQHADFTVEVFPTRTVVATRKPRPPVTSLEALRQLRVATIPGTRLMETAIEAGVPAEKIVRIVPGELSATLQGGKADAVVSATEGVILGQRDDPELEIGLFLGPPESLAYGVRKGQPELLASLNEHLRLLRATGTWNRLVVRYFGEAAPRILARAREGR